MNSSPLLFQVPLATEVLLVNQALVTSQDLSLDNEIGGLHSQQFEAWLHKTLM